MLGVLGVSLCYLFQAVARGPPPDPPTSPKPPWTPETEEDDKNGLSEEELRILGRDLRGGGRGMARKRRRSSSARSASTAWRPGRAVRVLPGCSRAFHQDCVDRWLTISPRCPVCNAWVTTQSPGTSPPRTKPALNS
ncbi:hypothetical protein OsJ_07856 [Oryza sativa Japonica Group]|uniref:RING-type E3 ubiquitin transferase n=1 Tax=Oryza sativa subsp. japonica TaxID=39947 RepID=A3A9X7_ORYSJ|nr:hypothetical protein OsJ_07856 [Oryza sativa Japonica Group]